MSPFFTPGGQSVESSASASVLPMNIQEWFPLELTGLISLQSKEFSRVYSNTTVQSTRSSVLSFVYGPTLTSIHDHWKIYSLTRWTFVIKVMSLLFNMLFRFVTAFLPRSKRLLISWLTITIYSDFGAQKNSLSLFPLFPHLFAMKWWDQMSWSSFSEYWVLSQLFHSSLSFSSRGSLVPL